jgi:hypothetical protein
MLCNDITNIILVSTICNPITNIVILLQILDRLILCPILFANQIQPPPSSRPLDCCTVLSGLGTILSTAAPSASAPSSRPLRHRPLRPRHHPLRPRHHPLDRCTIRLGTILSAAAALSSQASCDLQGTSAIVFACTGQVMVFHLYWALRFAGIDILFHQPRRALHHIEMGRKSKRNLFRTAQCKANAAAKANAYAAATASASSESAAATTSASSTVAAATQQVKHHSDTIDLTDGELVYMMEAH